MKIDWNKKYNTIAAYSTVAIVVAGAILMGLYYLFFSDKGDIFAMIGKLINILSPVFYGIGIAYILNFLMKFIEKNILPKIIKDQKKYKLKRIISLVITYLFTIFVISGFLWIVLPQIIESINNLAGKIPQYYDEYAPQVIQFFAERFPDVVYIDFKEAFNNFGNILTEISNKILLYLPKTFEFIQGTAIQISNFLIGFAISVYFLMSKEKFIAQMKKTIKAIFPEKHHDNVFEICAMTNNNFGGFLTGKLIDSLLMGVLYFIILTLFSVKYALLISVLMAVFNMIPFFGPIIGAVPSCLIVLIDNPWHVVLVIIVIFIMQLIEGNIIGPKLIGENTGLSAFWIITSILIFGGIWGVFGMIIAVPVFSVIYTLVKRFIEDKLKKKEMPHETKEYTDEKNPLIF